MVDYMNHLKKNIDIPVNYIHPGIKNKCWELASSFIEKNGVMLDLLTFPLVTDTFCQEVIQQAEKYSKWTTDRHANYPTHDMELKSFGWGMIYQKIIDEYITPLVINRWGMTVDGDSFTSESFIAKYSADWQDYLAVHNDNSTFSCLVALNDEFEGGGTYYPRQNIEVNLKPGYAVAHPELNYRHGGRAITKGTRYIIVSFIKRKSK